MNTPLASVPEATTSEVGLGFFNWAAPLFGHYADRWDDEAIAKITDWLRPYVAPGGRMLDVGGGTGALAARLSASLGAEVTVVDPTPEMLAYVSESPRVHALLGTAEAIPLGDDSVDAIIVTDAFHHFRDHGAAAREFARVVRQGGGIVVIEYDPTPWYMRILVAVEKLVGEPGAFFTRDQMCSYMAEHGIAGQCHDMTGPNYRYIGKVG